MKSSASNVVVERGNVEQENVFRIKATGKAFKILSDGLYTDKPMAIVRELSCNAYDSHVAAGKKDVPFEIHLPNTLEPYFSVKDYGVGLSHDQVMKLYTTYFESTKGDSNDFVGALGLGSKSPFSMVDAFTVTSNHNGRQGIYSAFISEDGIPAIALLVESETTEPNGVEVSLPIAERDINSFVEKTKKATAHFDPKPIVSGGQGNYKHQEYEIIMSGTGWRLCRINNFNYSVGRRSSDSVAIQGAVQYPIRSSDFSNLDKDIKEFLDIGVDLIFDIGDLEVSASRESLSFDTRTQENIISRCKVAMEEISNQIEAEVAKEKTLWDAIAKYKEITSASDRYYYLRNKVKCIFKGKVEETSIRSEKKFNELGIEWIKYHHKSSHRAQWENVDHRACFEPSKDYIFVINDLANKGTRRFTSAYKGGHFKESKTVAFLQFAEGQDGKKFFKEIGNPPYILVSSLPEPDKIVREGGKQKVWSKTVKAHMYNYSWSKEDLDMSKGGLYVLREGEKLYEEVTETNADGNTVTKTRNSTDKIRDIIQYANKLGYLKEEDVIVGLTAQQILRLKDNKNKWRLAQDFVKEKFVEESSKDSLIEKVNVRAEYARFKQSLKGYTESRLDVLFKTFSLSDKFSLGKFAEAHKVAKTTKIEKRELVDLANHFEDPAKLDQSPLGLLDKWEAVTTRYPLLEIIVEKYWDSDTDQDKVYSDIKEYIDLIDAKKG